MATNQLMHHCRRCRRATVHFQPSTAHVLHLIMSLLSLGMWVLVWMCAGMANASQKTCSVCGRVAGLLG